MSRFSRLVSLLALLGVVLCASSVRAASDHDLLGPETPKSVRCGEHIFDLQESGALRFASWHFLSREAIGPEDSHLVCGQFLGREGEVVGWICATEIYTPMGVVLGQHMCETVEKLLSGDH